MTNDLSLENRIQILEDRENIREAVYRYAWLLDEKKWDNLLELFCEDAILIVHPYGQHEGKNEIR